MKAITAIVLIAVFSMLVVATNLHNIGERNMRKLANHHRLITDNPLLDLNTGLPVECDTDSDCYAKTGISY